MAEVALNILFAVTFFLLGYALGRRRGHKSGFMEGKALMPLILRKKSLEVGRCVLCFRGPGEEKENDRAGVN